MESKFAKQIITDEAQKKLYAEALFTHALRKAVTALND